MNCASVKFNSEEYLFSGKLLPSNELIIRLSSKTFRNSVDIRKDRIESKKIERLACLHDIAVNNCCNENPKYKSLEQWKDAQIKDCDKAHKPTKLGKVGYGALPSLRVFNSRKRDNVRRLASALDKQFKPEQMLFLTFTLPASTIEAFKALASWSAYVFDRFTRLCSSNLGNNYARISVWEHQKRGALHAHMIVASNDAVGLQKVKDKFKQRCTDILDDVSSKSGVDMWRKNKKYSHKDNKDILQSQAVYVEKSVACYLSKYMSKGDKKGKNINKFCPSRWCTWSRSVKEIYNKFTNRMKQKRLTKKGATHFVEELLKVASYIAHQRYNKPLIYNDKFSNSINIRMIVGNDLLPKEYKGIVEQITYIINAIIDECEEKKNNYNPYKKVTLEQKEEWWYEQGVEEIRANSNRKGYDFMQQKHERKLAMFIRNYEAIKNMKKKLQCDSNYGKILSNTQCRSAT